MASRMTVRHIKKGERVDALSVAGEDFRQYKMWPITADIFDVGEECWCPLINSDEKGHGTLSVFLVALRKKFDKPLVFINVINGRLRKRLEKEGIECREVYGEDK